MGGLGRWLEISGTGDAEALHVAVTEHIVELLRQHVDEAIYERLTPYLSYAADNDEWGGCAEVLYWSFPDFAGNCTRSKYLWAHWFPIAIAAEWDAIGELARAHGFEVTSLRWSLDVRGDDGFLELRNNVWVIMETWLSGDGENIDIESLDADERAIVEAAKAACACGPCKRLTPGPRIERTPEQEASWRERAERAIGASMMAAHERRTRRGSGDD